MTAGCPVGFTKHSFVFDAGMIETKRFVNVTPLISPLCGQLSPQGEAPYFKRPSYSAH